MKTGLCLLVCMMLAAAPAAAQFEKKDSIYDINVTTIDGKEVSLADYRGKTLVIVNTASRCGFTKQYASFQELYEKFKGQGVEVLAFPANNFKDQEPGSNADIKRFCQANYGITFPLFAKISVKGDDIHPLFEHLTTQPGYAIPVSWNFNKFIVDKKGKLRGRYGSLVDPMEDRFQKELQRIVDRF